MHYYHQPHQPQGSGYAPPRPVPHGYQQHQHQQHQHQQLSQLQHQPGAYLQVPGSAPPAPVAGSPGAYLAAHPQQSYAQPPITPQFQRQPSHPMVMIPQRSPMQHQPMQLQPRQPQPMQQQFQQQPQYQRYVSQPQQYPPVQASRPQQTPQSRTYSPAVHPAASPPQQQPRVQVQIPRPSPATPPPIDKHQLLLSLSDEYVTSAHAMGPIVALYRRRSDEERYYTLMATGLGCMESLLKNFRLYPRAEALLILRYTTLLHQETENTIEAEEMLSKGITLCERHRMLDLKYTMQHLLARSLFKTNHAAALKLIDSVVRFAEMYQHIVWTYAFRLLRASLCMESGSHSDLTAAMHTLHEVSSLSEKLGDSAIYVTSTAILAMVHLRLMNPDCVEQAQRAIASARSLQLQLTVAELGQIVALLDLVDLACNLQSYKPDQAVAKMRDMQGVLDGAVSGDSSGDDGTFSVLIQRSSGGQLTTMTGGIFQKNADGKDRLSISWMRRRDLWMLGYYLSGVTAFLKNPTEDKAEKYLIEGLKLAGGSLSVADQNPSSVADAAARTEWHRALDWHFRLYQCFIACNKADWGTARKHLATLDQVAPIFTDERRASMTRFAIYLHGVIEQGGGNTEAALAQFRMLYTTIPTQRTAQGDVSILAVMNTLLMIRSPGHPMHAEAEGMLKSIEAQCQSHPNKSMVSAFHMLKATTQGKESSIVKMKQCIQLALHAAKSVANNQLLCICMNYMTAAFFTNIIGEQTEKSAKAGRVLAKRAGDRLWQCVADNMLADTYEKRGDVKSAAQARQEAETLLPYVPGQLR